jgi:hypothetical protein
MHPWIIYANEINGDRERQLKHLAILDEERRALAASTPMTSSQPSHVRHWVAQGLAFTSRMTAGAVRRLDECVADDLGRSLAPSE